MTKLRNIIKTFIGPVHTLGSGDNEITQEKVDKIKDELEKRIKILNRRILQLLVLTIVIIVVLVIALILSSEFLTVEKLATYSTLVGISPMAVGSFIVTAKKELEYTKIILGLVKSINRENINSILSVFLSLLK